MAIVLPKDKRFLIGFRFPELIPFEMNTFAPNMLLAPIFRLAVLDGSDSLRAKTDEATNISGTVQKLLAHARLHGFDGEMDSKLLDRLVRSSLVQITRVGNTKQ